MNLPDELKTNRVLLASDGYPDAIEAIVRHCARVCESQRSVYGSYPDRASVDEIARTILREFGLQP